jgi:GntR family transcriptional repressor for pyruvate dehydrogenase complex
MSEAYAPIERRKVYEIVTERLGAQIGTALQPGDTLPSERELAERYGVGRSSVREALRMLESQGVIAASGNGGFVVADAASPLNTSLRLVMTLDDGASIHDVFEVRRILECEAAALAAARHADRHLDEMDAAIAEMAAGLGEPFGDRYIDADLRFHLAIAEATGNRLVLHSMHAIRDVIRRALMQIFLIPKSAERSIEQHRAIRRAIAERDETRARAEMRAHLTRVESDVARGGLDG